MSSIARKSVDMSVRGSRLVLKASQSRNVAVAANRTPFVQQKLAANNQKTFTRLVSLSCSRLNDSSKSEPEVPVIPIEIVERIVQDQFILIDVRTPQEVAEQGKIPTASILPVDDVESALKLNADEFRLKYHFEKPSPSAVVIVYCRSGKRAARAGAIFRDQFGYKNVVNYKGSWMEWSEKHPEDVKVPDQK